MNPDKMIKMLKKAADPEQGVQQTAPVQNPGSKNLQLQGYDPERDAVYLLAKAKCLMAKIMMKTSRQALHLELTGQVPGIFGSKVGGVP